LEVSSPAFWGVFAFAFAAIISGWYFMGFDTEPPAAVGAVVTTVQQWTGIAMIIAGFLVFLGSPAGPELSVWFGTLLGTFGFVWAVLGFSLAKGGDLKPISTFLLITGIILTAYTVYNGQLLELGLALFTNLFIILLVATVGCYAAFIGIRWMPILVKFAGACFLAAGVVGLWLVIDYLSDITKTVVG